MGIPYAEVIGDPIAHSKSPVIHKYWLEKLRIEGDYKATRVTAGELPGFLAMRRENPDWRGCNVTMPLKHDVAALLDQIDPSAEWAGSVNCVFRDGDELWGCNTDVSGITLAIADAPIQRNAVTVIGTGAAAQAALWSLAQEEPGELRIVARDLAKANAVLDALRTKGRCFEIADSTDAFSGATIIINATPLGMTGFAEMPKSVLDALRHSRVDATVFDMVYHPIDTAFLAAAATYGRRSIDGLTMLIGQAQDSFADFFRAQAPIFSWRDSDLRELLTQ